MEVFCTGATGFVGAHTVTALLDAGHELRLLVRDERAARRWFESRGGRIARYVTADIRDPVAVERAMVGCDAVFHAAATVSLDPRRARETYDNNVGATKTVLDTARALDIGNVLHVSSVTALFHPGAAFIDESTPLANAVMAYSRSKRDSDEYVRGLQNDGMPVQIVYPTGVIGPDDPKLSALNYALKNFVCQVLPRTTSGLQCVDVRDLARAHLWMLHHPVESGSTDARYIVGGHYYPWDELRRLLEFVLGRKLFSPRVAPGVMRAMGAAVDLLRVAAPIESQISAESMAINTLWPPADSTRFTAKSGLVFRSGEESFGDTIRWMVETGHIPARRAGSLAVRRGSAETRGVMK
ncbi:NAD-dependent epimerase/dehydratase family protein [Mycobacterium sp. 1164985.4]|uniref:NAD-dependent epimerase/dehydratase family protein n=1 Tax=Mycobacterium sp. 1164985.4 TaxID=1834069 RepID=UPI00080214F3|nr:NAD-dependent epimerase/dehydratase family protein [Mycobacterium sp. 1164985.4]OBK76508.1 dihydroflavonol 4-reductase [Mycobacterium sp. 1164985.4]